MDRADQDRRSCEPHPGLGCRVLLVDDDCVFTEAIAGILRDLGYEVRPAPDHRLALEILEGDEPLDLLITDIVMPDRVNGLALGRMARLRRPDLKIIYITGHDIPGLTDEALGPVLRKPIDNDHLVAEIERALPQVRSPLVGPI
jgi:CheY-like chemotaxis protein